MDDQLVVMMTIALAGLLAVTSLFFLRTAQVRRQQAMINDLQEQIAHGTEMLEATQRQKAFDKRTFDAMLAEKDVIIETRTNSLKLAQTAASNLRVDVDVLEQKNKVMQGQIADLLPKAAQIDFIVDNKLNLGCYKDKPGSKVFLWRVVEHDPDSTGKLHTIGNGATVAAAVSSAIKKLNARKKR
jgi:hypothetical protein